MRAFNWLISALTSAGINAIIEGDINGFYSFVAIVPGLSFEHFILMCDKDVTYFFVRPCQSLSGLRIGGIPGLLALSLLSRVHYHLETA